MTSREESSLWAAATWPWLGGRRRKRFLAALVAVAWVALLAIVVADARNWVTYPAKSPQSDLDLYWAEANRVAAGETYYEAAKQELIARGFPTASTFNWRTPLPMWLLGKLPRPVYGKVLLACAGSALAGWGGILLLQKSGRIVALTGTIALCGSVLPCFVGELYVSPILWASVFVGLSLCAESTGHARTGILLGTVAAVFRELAAGYCLLAACRALARGRRREAAEWCLGVACFAVWYLWHMYQVATIVGGARVADTSMWWNLKSPWYLVQCAQMNGFLIVLPRWVSMVYLTFALVGLVYWSRRSGELACWTVIAYLAVFLVVGHRLNDYWGELISPPLAMGFGHAPAAFTAIRRQLS